MRIYISMLILLLSYSWSSAQNITAAEYYLDNIDPGYGNAIPLPVPNPGSPLALEDVISTTGISPGVHYLNFRVRHDSSWSDTHRSSFRVKELPKIAKDTARIIQGEYYFGENDPGLGSAFPITLPNFTKDLRLLDLVDVSGLSAGFHQLYLRLKQENGGWSTTSSWSFYLYDSLATQKLVRIEYEIRQGGNVVGSGTVPISPSQYTVEMTFDASTNALTEGSYEFCATAVDEGSRESSANCRVFQVMGGSTAAEELLEKDISVYPNPTTGPLTIKTETRSLLNYQLSDVNGRVVDRRALSPGTRELSLDIRHLPVGTYFLALELPGMVIIKPIVLSL